MAADGYVLDQTATVDVRERREARRDLAWYAVVAVGQAAEEAEAKVVVVAVVPVVGGIINAGV